MNFCGGSSISALTKGWIWWPFVDGPKSSILQLILCFWFKWSHSLEAFEGKFGVDLLWADQRRRCSVKEFANSTNTIQVAVEGCRSCACFAAAHFRLTETAMDSIQISYYINDTFSDCSMFMAVFYRPKLGEIPEILSFIAHFNPN